MALCSWCRGEMATVDSCTCRKLHHAGRAVPLVPYGSETGPYPYRSPRCGDCNVVRGGFHHLGCDIQQCPRCRDRMMSCGCVFDEDDAVHVMVPTDAEIGVPTEPIGVDENGAILELGYVDAGQVVFHREDIPDCDRAEVNGIPVTSALRTLIDIAPQLSEADLRTNLDDLVDRGLIDLRDAWHRIAQPDMVNRRGALMLRRVLPPAPL